MAERGGVREGEKGEQNRKIRRGMETGTTTGAGVMSGGEGGRQGQRASGRGGRRAEPLLAGQHLLLTAPAERSCSPDELY